MAMLTEAHFKTQREAQQPDTGVVLSVQNLSLDFRLRNEVLHAARDVSFELRKGQTLCLVGESGSGKSVTARAILRILDKNGSITGGRILLRDGHKELDLATLSEKELQRSGVRGGRIGLIFQEPMVSLLSLSDAAHEPSP